MEREQALVQHRYNVRFCLTHIPPQEHNVGDHENLHALENAFLVAFYQGNHRRQTLTTVYVLQSNFCTARQVAA